MYTEKHVNIIMLFIVFYNYDKVQDPSILKVVFLCLLGEYYTIINLLYLNVDDCIEHTHLVTYSFNLFGHCFVFVFVFLE